MFKNIYISVSLIFFMHSISVAEKLGNGAVNSKPISVYILSGQSNMVGAGKVDGGSSRWGAVSYTHLTLPTKA